MRSLAYSRGNAVSLWVKIVPDEDSNVLLAARELFMNKGRNDQALAYLYSGLLTEIDCSKNSHRELITILYDANKNILHSADHPNANWRSYLRKVVLILYRRPCAINHCPTPLIRALV